MEAAGPARVALASPHFSVHQVLAHSLRTTLSRSGGTRCNAKIYSGDHARPRSGLVPAAVFAESEVAASVMAYTQADLVAAMASFYVNYCQRRFKLSPRSRISRTVDPQILSTTQKDIDTKAPQTTQRTQTPEDYRELFMVDRLTGGATHREEDLHSAAAVRCSCFFSPAPLRLRTAGVAKKKLFSKKLLPPSRANKVSKKFRDEKMPISKLHLIADENSGGFLNAKKNGNPSVDYEHKHELRAPSLVARLMGLESMPATREQPKKASFADVSDSGEKTIVNNCSGNDREELNLETQNGKSEARPQKLQKMGPYEKRAVTRFGAEALKCFVVLEKASPKACFSSEES
nr:uncharacterized protein LOC103411799 [Malus domestica]